MDRQRWNKPFPISSICREDLKEYFTDQQIATLDDGDMERIASKMGDAHMNTYWIDMEIIAENIIEDKEKESDFLVSFASSKFKKEKK